MPSTNPIDLTTLANVKAWAGVSGASLDQELQDIITSFSLYALHVTGRANADGSVPTASPFIAPVDYDEFYDGNGNDKLPLHNWPINSVALVNDSGVIIKASSGITSPGYVVDQSKKFLVLRRGGTLYPQRVMYGRGGAWGGQFGRTGWNLGTQNIEVQYTAGFSGVPFDLEMVARKTCALNYKRTQWIGQRAQAMAAGAGTVSYNTWEMDMQDVRTLMYYIARVA